MAKNTKIKSQASKIKSITKDQNPDNLGRRNTLDHQWITDWLQVIISFIMAIATIVGLYFIWSEFTQIKKQNELLQTQNESLKESIVQTYRPIAMAKHDWSNSQERTVDFKFINEKQINIKIDLKIKNIGNGLLTYIGVVNGIAFDKIDFRNFFLSKNPIINVKGDINHQIIQTNILRNVTSDYHDLVVIYKNIPIKEVYYCHILLFYLDQDGNLYDTEHIERISLFSKQNSSNNMELKNNSDKTIVVREDYHRYSHNEKIKLKKALKHYSLGYIEID